jgi:hypothetical protein
MNPTEVFILQAIERYSVGDDKNLGVFLSEAEALRFWEQETTEYTKIYFMPYVDKVDFYTEVELVNDNNP